MKRLFQYCRPNYGTIYFVFSYNGILLAPRLYKISELKMFQDKGYQIKMEVQKDETRAKVVGEHKQVDC